MRVKIIFEGDFGVTSCGARSRNASMLRHLRNVRARERGKSTRSCIFHAGAKQLHFSRREREFNSIGWVEGGEAVLWESENACGGKTLDGKSIELTKRSTSLFALHALHSTRLISARHLTMSSSDCGVSSCRNSLNEIRQMRAF